MPRHSTYKAATPPYWLGLLCIIPLVGAFVGLGLLLYGIFKYRNKKLVIIGIAGIVWSIVIYSSLFYAMKHTTVFKQGFSKLSQQQLNTLVKELEFYKSQHGQYPDSLPQLLIDNANVSIADPIQLNQQKTSTHFYYEKKGNKYLLFSVGNDGKPNTSDDIQPSLTLQDSGSVGLITVDSITPMLNQE
ncbi:MAG: type II secretion system protein GspG [Bacteroidetes bacterium]|uniref:type II secretion system protein GspG n=1 Tax=Phnomibacter sp. TaxID=2836217 RepID=UPI002FDD78B4|nr:type II secretion system protein GspG [Bacteroidota bacterium]